MENFSGTVAVPPGKLFEKYSLCVDFPVKRKIINFPGEIIA